MLGGLPLSTFQLQSPSTETLAQNHCHILTEQGTTYPQQTLGGQVVVPKHIRTMHIYLVLLCLLSVVRVTQGYSQFPCADRNGPRYCAYARCTVCVGLDCRRDDKMDLFKSMCCDSDVAHQLEECIRLCENLSSTNLTRYDHDTKEPARLCPPNEIIWKCKQCLPCSEEMCIQNVQMEVFIQQCLSKLNYDQLQTSECKVLAHTYNTSTPTMVTDDLKPSTPAKSNKSQTSLVTNALQPSTPAKNNKGTTSLVTDALEPSIPVKRSGITTSSASESYKPETTASANPPKPHAYQPTTDAYSTTTPAYLTTTVHIYHGFCIGCGIIIAVMVTALFIVGFIGLDRKCNGSKLMHLCWPNSKTPEKREVKNKESNDECLSETETDPLLPGVNKSIDEKMLPLQESIEDLTHESSLIKETLFIQNKYLLLQLSNLKEEVNQNLDASFNHKQPEDDKIKQQKHDETLAQLVDNKLNPLCGTIQELKESLDQMQKKWMLDFSCFKKEIDQNNEKKSSNHKEAEDDKFKRMINIRKRTQVPLMIVQRTASFRLGSSYRRQSGYRNQHRLPKWSDPESSDFDFDTENEGSTFGGNDDEAMSSDNTKEQSHPDGPTE